MSRAQTAVFAVSSANSASVWASKRFTNGDEAVRGKKDKAHLPISEG